MLVFFPNPYPDELLYSVFARYHIRSGNTSPKITTKELFSISSSAAIVDLPCNLNKLIENMPPTSKYTAEELIYNNTLYPYYEAFLPKDRAERIVKDMKEGSGGSIHTRIGIMASSIQSPKYLRYCPQCSIEDKVVYGELYWHRIFQIPSVLVCPKHKSILCNSVVLFHGENKHEYIYADEKNCKVLPQKMEFNKEEIEKLVLIAKDIEFFLDNEFRHKSRNWICEKYKELLIKKELATINGRVNQKELVASFVNYYEYRFLKLLQSEIDYDFNANWLSSIVRKHRKVFDPVRHLLLIRFLECSIEEFFQEEYSYKAFGKGPWLCLNRGATHYHQAVIKELKITYDADTKQPVGTFYCSCGFVYSRRGPDKNEGDQYRIGRVKKFGMTWEEKLKELIGDKTLSLREIGRRMSVDVKTVKKYAQKLDIKEVNINMAEDRIKKENALIEKEKKKIQYREQWKSLQLANEEFSKNQLRQIDKATYLWIYRNDKDWLDENSPLIKQRVTENNRVDWKQRDQELLKQVKDQVEIMIKSSEKPERITVSRIGRKLGCLSLLEKHINKLPSTNTYLESVTEDVETYQIRRIRWVTHELYSEGKELKPWNIIRAAGIKENASETIKKAIENEIYYYSNLLKSNYMEKRSELHE